MTRYIDADALKLSHCKGCSLYPDKCMGDDCDWGAIIHINAMPTIEAEPVKHGKWIREVRYTIDSLHSYQQYRCSECGMTYITNTKHCPNCGAYMKGTEDD